MVRMKHPLHGFHHAYDANEEARMRLNGWTAEDEPDQDEGEEDPDDEEVGDTPRVKRQYNRAKK